jgi:hypothetical protein
MEIHKIFAALLTISLATASCKESFECNDDKFIGSHLNCQFKFANGDSYRGRANNGVKEGQGSYFYADGGQYQGQFLNGEANGIGTFRYSNGDKYVGQVKNGKRHGTGSYYFATTGDIYKGNWINDLEDGQAIYKWIGEGPNKGDVFIGNHKNGKATGRGFMLFANGDKYIGDFLDGSFNGIGTYYFLDQKKDVFKYSGQFSKNKRHGKGQHFFRNGDIYTGDFYEEWEHGKGILLFANGESYVGEFNIGMRNGIGSLFDRNGEEVFRGEWFNNQIIRSVKLQ